MRPRYRRKLIHLIANQVCGELAGAELYGMGVRCAPGVDEKRLAADLSREEAEHGALFAELLRELGVSPERVGQYRRARRFFGVAQRVLVPRVTWLDVVMFNLVVDHYAYYLLEDFSKSSYAPLGRAAAQIFAEEERHLRLGPSLLRAEVARVGASRVQRAVGKWWRMGLNFFGVGARNEAYRKLSLVPRSADERLAAFRADLEPQLVAAGLRVPRLIRHSFPYV
jgi:1,2-phenylacetyl-CoA epoxidase catalytic subunit